MHFPAIKLTFLLVLSIQSIASHVFQEPLTTSEWSLRFKCDANQTDVCRRNEANKPEFCTREEDVCARDPADWMWKYVDELEPEFQVYIEEESIDQRLANIVYTTVTTRGFDVRFNKIQAKNPADQEDLERLLIGPQVNESLCGEQLQVMLSQLDSIKDKKGSLNETHIRIARVLDSFGRYESGFLSGRFQSFGSYDQCINTQLLLNEQQVTSMRYCWAHLNLDANLSPQLRDRKRFAHEFGETAISVGVCLPESCHSKSLNKHKQSIQRLLDSQFKFPSSFYERETVNISSMDCVADSKSPMGVPTSGKILLTVLCVWLSIIIYATRRAQKSSISDTQKSVKSNCWFTCVSFTHCWQDFVESGEITRPASEHINFDVLNPVKVMTCFLFTLAHGLASRHTISNSLLRDHKLLELNPMVSMFLAGPLIVESFFAFSGILVTYVALKQQHKEAQKSFSGSKFGQNCAKFIVKRYIRLLPLLYLVVAFKKSILVYLGSGPMWNYGLNVNSFGQCQHESWLAPMMVISYAYEPYARRCLPQTYTITCELLFVIFIAPLVYLINKWPRIIISLCLFLSFWSNYVGLLAFNKLDAALRWNFIDLRSFGLFQMFASPIGYMYGIPDYRLSSILFGVIGGYFIYKYEQSKLVKHEQESQIIDNNWPKLKLALTCFAIVYLASINLVGLFKNELRLLLGQYFRLIIGQHYLFTVKLLWAAASTIMMCRVITDWNQIEPLAWTKSKLWRCLAKLNYPILLVHLDLLLLDWQMQSTQSHLSMYNEVKTFIFAYVSSLVVGTLLHLLVESPISRLARKFHV